MAIHTEEHAAAGTTKHVVVEIVAGAVEIGATQRGQFFNIGAQRPVDRREDTVRPRLPSPDHEASVNKGPATFSPRISAGNAWSLPFRRNVDEVGVINGPVWIEVPIILK